MATRRRESGSARSEEELVRRALAGERDAFDLLYDRYFELVARYLRRHGPTEMRHLIHETLEELFTGLGVAEPSLSERAYRIARAASRRAPVAPSIARTARPSPGSRKRAR
jgi:hypothetical protein